MSGRSEEGRSADGSGSDLRDLADRARERAYAPYSGFRVGCAVETADGRRFSGCNVENASYGLTVCAERAAVAAAVVAGARELRRLVIVSDSSEPVAPCGACRQVLMEFGAATEVISLGAAGGERRWTAGELLPDAFSAAPRAERGRGPGAGRE